MTDSKDMKKFEDMLKSKIQKSSENNVESILNNTDQPLSEENIDNGEPSGTNKDDSKVQIPFEEIMNRMLTREMLDVLDQIDDTCSNGDSSAKNTEGEDEGEGEGEDEEDEEDEDEDEDESESEDEDDELLVYTEYDLQQQRNQQWQTLSKLLDAHVLVAQSVLHLLQDDN